MPLFSYAARNERGELVQGEVEAGDEFLAVNLVQGGGLVLTKIENRGYVSAVASRKQRRHRRVKSKDVLFFVQQVSLLLDSGIAMIRALEVVSSQIESTQLHQIVTEIKDSIKRGSTLQSAIAKYPKHFPVYWSAVIGAGEESGNLSKVLVELGKGLEGDIQFRTKLVSAMIYPAILITVSIAAMLVLLTFIIPIFAKIFEQFGAKLPPLTNAIIEISHFVKNYILFIIGSIIGFIFLFKWYISTPGGRAKTDRALLKIPIVGGMVTDIIHARVNMILATLIESGLNLLKSLEIAAGVSGNFVYSTALKNVVAQVQQGKTLAACLAKDPLFSSMMAQLVAIGEESGRLSAMLVKVAKYHSERADVFTSRLSTMIEPLVLIFVGGVIGVLVVSMFLPIINLANVIK